MPQYLAPFVACIIFCLPIYKFVSPRLSDGKVALLQSSKLKYAGFIAAFSISFLVLYAVLTVGVAFGIAHYVESYVNVMPANTMFFVSGAFRLLMAEIVFFLLTVIYGRLFKSVLKVESLLGAWLTSWVLGFVAVASAMVAEFILMNYVSGYYER